jgi:hypothetical protein
MQIAQLHLLRPAVPYDRRLTGRRDQSNSEAPIPDSGRAWSSVYDFGS